MLHFLKVVALLDVNVGRRGRHGCISKHVIVAATLLVHAHLFVRVLNGNQLAAQVVIAAIISNKSVEFKLRLQSRFATKSRSDVAAAYPIVHVWLYSLRF